MKKQILLLFIILSVLVLTSTQILATSVPKYQLTINAKSALKEYVFDCDTGPPGESNTSIINVDSSSLKARIFDTKYRLVEEGGHTQ